MTPPLPLRCRCGTVRGILTDPSPATGNRAICYCDDCQAFAHFLGRDDVLDRHGGTDIFQTRPAQLAITQGKAELRCMRLSDKGLLRWYTACCKTPVGNTLASARVPFVGVIHAFMDHAGDGRTSDAVLGPVRAYIWGKFAIGDVPAHIHPKAPPAFIARAVWFFLRAWLAGGHSPTPFFDPKSGRPIVEPEVLDPTQRRALAH